METTIRPATIADAPALADLMIEAAAYHAAALPAIFRHPESPAGMIEFVHKLLADAQSRILVAAQGAAIIGLAQLALRESPSLDITVPRRFMVVENLAVREAQRGQGVGKSLLLAAEQLARAEGIVEIQLNVWEFNASARALYERSGYSTITRRMSKILE